MTVPKGAEAVTGLAAGNVMIVAAAFRNGNVGKAGKGLSSGLSIGGEKTDIVGK